MTTKMEILDLHTTNRTNSAPRNIFDAPGSRPSNVFDHPGQTSHIHVSSDGIIDLQKERVLAQFCTDIVVAIRLCEVLTTNDFHNIIFCLTVTEFIKL